MSTMRAVPTFRLPFICSSKTPPEGTLGAHKVPENFFEWWFIHTRHSLLYYSPMQMSSILCPVTVDILLQLLAIVMDLIAFDG